MFGSLLWFGIAVRQPREAETSLHKGKGVDSTKGERMILCKMERGKSENPSSKYKIKVRTWDIKFINGQKSHHNAWGMLSMTYPI